MLALKRCLNAHDVAPAVIDAVVQFYTISGVDEMSDFPLQSIVTACGIYKMVDFYHPDLKSGLSSKHWLMETSPSDELVSILSRFLPGTLSARNNQSEPCPDSKKNYIPFTLQAVTVPGVVYLAWYTSVR